MVARWLAGAAVALVLVVAATAGPGRIWTVPEPTGDGPGAPTVEIDERSRPEADAPADDGWLAAAGPALVVLAIAVAGVVGVGGLLTLGELRTWRPHLPAPRWVRRRTPIDTVLPPDERPLDVDAGRAFAALRTGVPRNSIVACWAQLETDAAAAGWPRDDAETSTEYVERVVASMSLDRRPIGELAELARAARFSSEPITDTHRARAVELLGDTLDALTRADGVAR